MKCSGEEGGVRDFMLDPEASLHDAAPQGGAGERMEEKGHCTTQTHLTCMISRRKPWAPLGMVSSKQTNKQMKPQQCSGSLMPQSQEDWETRV